MVRLVQKNFCEIVMKYVLRCTIACVLLGMSMQHSSLVAMEQDASYSDGSDTGSDVAMPSGSGGIVIESMLVGESSDTDDEGSVDQIGDYQDNPLEEYAFDWDEFNAPARDADSDTLSRDLSFEFDSVSSEDEQMPVIQADSYTQAELEALIGTFDQEEECDLPVPADNQD